MTDLLIGLCFGMLSAIALVVMWRMAGRLRREGRPRDGARPAKRPPPRDEGLTDSGADG